MSLFDNENRIIQIKTEKEEIFFIMEDPLINQPYNGRFCRKFFIDW